MSSAWSSLRATAVRVIQLGIKVEMCLDAIVRVDGVTLTQQREFRAYPQSGIRDLCQPGDSGGPVYFGRVAKGIVSAIDKVSRNCYYTHIDHAVNALVTGSG